METTLTAQNIIITIYPPTAGQLVTVDMSPYYSNLCCFEVIAVQSEDNKKQDGIIISPDKTSIIYTPDVSDDYWQNADDYDVIEYCIRDINTQQTAIGKLTIQVVEQGLFSAADVCFNFKYTSLMEEIDGNAIVKLDLSLINKFEDVQIEEIGVYSTKLFKQIAFDPDNQAGIVVYGNKQCNNWHPTKRTEVEYAISALIDGERSTSKAKIIFTCIDDFFYANSIRIEIVDSSTEYVIINVREYNALYAEVDIDRFDSTLSERGNTTLIGTNYIRYDLNLDSGFWDNEFAQDVFRYTIINSTTGKKACSYISIEKKVINASGSGSGSGGPTAPVPFGSGSGSEGGESIGPGILLIFYNTVLGNGSAGLMIAPLTMSGINVGGVTAILSNPAGSWSYTYKGEFAGNSRYELKHNTGNNVLNGAIPVTKFKITFDRQSLHHPSLFLSGESVAVVEGTIDF